MRCETQALSQARGDLSQQQVFSCEKVTHESAGGIKMPTAGLQECRRALLRASAPALPCGTQVVLQRVCSAQECPKEECKRLPGRTATSIGVRIKIAGEYLCRVNGENPPPPTAGGGRVGENGTAEPTGRHRVYRGRSVEI